ncbi:CENP-B protein, partial [Didymella exigua CBS 183.55]
LIQGVSAIGRVILPFLIFASKTNNNIALAWLKHFDVYTKVSSAGAYRLLIINSHESHCSIEFQDYCKENKIITLCMPPHSSHILQPLDVVPYSLLKRHYSDRISLLARSRIYYINKETFLLAFKVAFKKMFTLENICAGF